MLYNKRAADKLECWYEYCKYKPVHIVVLERYQANYEREHGFGETAGIVRRERDAAWWETVKALALPDAIRKREDILHTRSGAQTSVDGLMAKVEGIGWRRRTILANRSWSGIDDELISLHMLAVYYVCQRHQILHPEYLRRQASEGCDSAI